ncbi:ABC transporter permease [Halomarina litorea]|uniref:ABC transporter permease n=1 Tax=Halomarina litorea TaxID=2961595 RepID=UPI0020C38279|nr:ABC transporter permease [Halomarina sp. BCD28]
MSMRWYVARRVAWAVLATYLILSITFGLLAVSPGNGQTAFAFSAATSGGDVEEAQETFKKITGRDKPVLERYQDYMVNMATLNWGWSFTRNQPVMDAIAEAYPYSLMYFLPATVISLILGYGIGLYSATHQYTKTDYFGTFVAFFGISIPNFWFGIMLILIFGVTLGWLPTFFQTQAILDHGVFSVANAKQLVMPVVVLSTAAMAANMRYSRAEALEYVHAEFVKTARAKGASDWRVLLRHIFRPALVPLMTILIGDILAVLFAGAYITEVVFQIPGLGQLSYKAIIQQDTPLVLATTLIPVFLVIIGNLLQDIAYTVLDPRIDYEGR